MCTWYTAQMDAQFGNQVSRMGQGRHCATGEAQLLMVKVIVMYVRNIVCIAAVSFKA